jgi:hypothetical protein
MGNATIIQLQPSESITSVVRFEDAFGEYSEASGKRRKRRQERRMERIKNRQERRKTRREGRLLAAQERNVIKGERRRGRLERRHMKDQYDNSETGNGDVGDNSNGGDSLPPVSAPSQDNGSYQDNYQDTSNQGGGDYQGGNEYANDGAPTDSYSEDTQSEDDSQDSGDDSNYSEDSGFDGVMGAEDRFAEFTDSDIKVNPTVQDIANKIEWNKELISRLRIKAAIQRGKNQSTSDTLMDIEKRKLRITELENQLKGYSNADGEFSSANGCYCSYDGFNNDTDSNFDNDSLDNESLMNSFDGDSMDNEELMSNAEGRRIRKNRPKNKVEKQNISNRRKKEIGRAYSVARKERSKHTVVKPKQSNVTPVSASLKPVISPNRIEVTLNAEGTGNIALDNTTDIDAPVTRIFEMTSSADGGSKNPISAKGVLIGVGIAAVAIWALNKYKIV